MCQLISEIRFFPTQKTSLSDDDFTEASLCLLGRISIGMMCFCPRRSRGEDPESPCNT